jgi:hypothetical protein
MKIKEINKLIAWLAAVFPQWKPDKATTTVWMHELPDVSADVAMSAVRSIQSKDISPFPPTVFRVLKELNGDIDPSRKAKIAFAIYWQGRVPNDPIAHKTLRLASPEGYGQCLTADRAWPEKRFVELYEGLSQKESSLQLKEGSWTALSAGKLLLTEPVETVDGK